MQQSVPASAVADPPKTSMASAYSARGVQP
ncbi:MAG: hypothetical protein QOI40_3761, partial [Alphaproteobacteria bacterium]|nr:hypothetical protein [Alphaproteobacteria bacterium]